MILWAVLLIALNSVWLMLNLLALPGNWLMVISTLLVAVVNWKAGMFSQPTLVVIVLLAILAEVAELLAGAVGAKKAGGTRRGATGALFGGMIGGLVGTFVIPVPVIGSLLGICVGACAGALVLELMGGRQFLAAMRSGVGAGMGSLAGTVLKFLIGAAIWAIVAIAAFWP